MLPIELQRSTFDHQAHMRTALAATALTLALAGVLLPGPAVLAQDSRLPDIGSSAGTVLSPALQKEYGQYTLSQLRNYGYTLDDPLISAWLQSVGSRLGAGSDKPAGSYTLFMLKDRQINAFATLGGYIGVNAGLVLAADEEDEVAAVLAHEIAHVTQQHVLRGVERAQRDSIPILLAMIGAIALAQSAGGNSSDDAILAAVTSAQGLIAQRQIDYTRSHEAEADRIGIRTMARSGYDPDAMAEFFQKLQTVIRSNPGRESAPDYLKTHPVTTTRISEAKQRAERVAPEAQHFNVGAGANSNPLLPASMRIDTAYATGSSGQFGWARERLRVLTATTPANAVREYGSIGRAGKLDAWQRYGLALAKLLDGQPADAASDLTPLLAEHPDNVWLALALAQAEARSGKREASDARFEALLARLPNNRAVALTYAGMLNERNTVAAGKRAQALLRPLLNSASNDPVFQQTFARASEIAGDTVRAGEAWAETAYLNGRPEQALVQLNTLKRREDVDYYERARIDARIAAITPIVLELQRQGIRDEDLNR